METSEGGREACASSEQLPIDSLDDPLLCRVLFLAGKPNWPAIALTCRRWHELLYTDPALWSTLRLETAQLDFLSRPKKEAWFRQKRALLRRVAPLVTALAVHDRTGMLRSGAHGTAGAWGLPDLLGMLCPGVVAELELEAHPSPPAEALDALPRLASGLTALNLDAQRLPAAAAAVLPRLARLASLRLAAQHLPEGALPAILRLPLLCRLELESSFLPLPSMAPLTALCRLRQLRLVDDSERSEPLQLPAPADFGAQGGLESLTAYTRRMCQVAETRAGFLFLHRVRQERHAHASLSLDGHCSAHAQLGSLPALLAALLPGEESSAPVAGSAPLRYLRLGGFRRLSPPEVQGCAGLGAVQHLSLGGCGGGSDAAALEGVQAALAALLHQMPALQELDLARWPGSSLPGWLVASMPPGLTKLELGESGLASLPHGAALAGLQELGLHNCRRLQLTDADVEQLLSNCPSLQAVRLDSGAAGEAAAALAAALAARREATLTT